MSDAVFFLPAILQMLLTLSLYIALAVAKSKAANSGQVNLERRALHADAWPDNVLKINNNIRNQFEVPVLFYVITLILWQLEMTGMAIQALGWLFVGSRFVHAYVHTGSNTVPVRRRVFMIGSLIVIIMAFIALGTVLRAVY